MFRQIWQTIVLSPPPVSACALPPPYTCMAPSQHLIILVQPLEIHKPSSRPCPRERLPLAPAHPLHHTASPPSSFSSWRFYRDVFLDSTILLLPLDRPAALLPRIPRPFRLERVDVHVRLSSPRPRSLGSQDGRQHRIHAFRLFH